VKFIGIEAGWADCDFLFRAWRPNKERVRPTLYDNTRQWTLGDDCINPLLWIFCTDWER